MVGPMDGLVVGAVGGIVGPTTALGALGPYPSSESLSLSAPSCVVSPWVLGRVVFAGGESGLSSSSGLRLRLARCGGSWGPMEDILVVELCLYRGLATGKWSEES